MNLEEAKKVLALAQTHIADDDSWSANITTVDGESFAVTFYLRAEQWEDYESEQAWLEKRGDIWLNEA